MNTLNKGKRSILQVLTIVRLDYEGLINAVGELMMPHKQLIHDLLTLPNHTGDLDTPKEEMMFYDNYDANRARSHQRRVAHRSYAEVPPDYDEEPLTHPIRPMGPGRPAASKENRPVSSLSDQEHAHLFYIIQALERHNDSHLLHLRVAQSKSKAPTPIPLFASIRTKARRKRYKCLQDYVDHVNLLWEHLGDSCQRLAKHFDYLVNYYFAAQEGVTGKRRSWSVSSQDSPSESPEDEEAMKRQKCT